MKITKIGSIIIMVMLILTSFSITNALSPTMNTPNTTFDDSMIGGLTEDRFEDNDDINNSSTVRAGNYSALTCTDDDWYKISMNSGQDLTVTINFNNSEGDLDLELYDSFGLLDNSQGTSDSEIVSYSGVNSTGFYYIKVFGYLNSTNNYTMEISTADITPPKILSRLLVRHNSPTSVNISWVANELCTSVLKYSTYAFGRFLGELTNSNYSNSHSFTLTNLTPYTTYTYWITLTDRNNNSDQTGPFYFRTKPASDDYDPTLEILVPNIISGKITVKVTASDLSGIEKVEFYLNGTYMFTDYSNDYEWEFDTVELDNGPFAIGAKAFDNTGRFDYQEKNVTVANPVSDSTPPTANFVSLSEGERVTGGNVSITITSKDMDSGINSIEFYVNGKHIWTELVNGEAGVEERATYYWNTYGENKSQRNNLTIKVTNNDGLSSSKSIGVYSDNSKVLMPYPKDIFAIKPFELTRGQVRRESTYYEVKLYIKNLCSKELYSIVVKDYNFGFQTISSEYGYQQTAYYTPSTKTSHIKFSIGSLKAGEIKTLKYNMVPILYAPDPRIDFVIGEKTEVLYKESQGIKIGSTLLEYNVPAVEMMDGWFSTTSVPITMENILTPMNTRDYLVVTHPGNLFGSYLTAEVNELLSKLAEFSRHKNGVLGYLSSTIDACVELLDAINPSLQFKVVFHSGGQYSVKISKGGWNNLLTPDWSSNGYLLLVGEINVVPSFNSLGWDIHWTSGHETPIVKFTDIPYADFTGDGIPELKVGRLIGNTPTILMKQIDTSLGVYLNRQGYKFDKSAAMLISGTGSSYKGFIQNVEDIEDILTSQNRFVKKVHGYECVPIDDFYFDFEIHDLIGVGNIYYDSKGEIIIGSWKDDKVYIYKPDGTLIKSFTRSLDWRDSMVVGDIMGDEKDEICIIDYYTGELDIYQGWVYGGGGPGPTSRSTRAPPPGSLMISKVGTFDTDYYYIDEVSIGDVWGDDKEEIVLGDESANKIKIYDYLGNLVNSFNCPFYYYDGLAVGEVHSNNKEEIVIGESISNKITIKSNTGTTLDTFDFSYGYGDSITIGEFHSQTNEEIIIGKGGDRYVYYCFYKNNVWKIGKTPIEIPYKIDDGLAIGNIVDDGMHEIVVGNNVENKIQYFDINWGTRMNIAFESNCKYKDIIHYCGHGNINKFSSFAVSPTHFPMDFGGTNPVVIAPSCLCGDYVNGPIAESFMDSGAGVFIGSTEVSRIPENVEAAKLLYNTYWDQNSIDIGTAFTNLCRDQYPLGFYWRFWVTEFNLYGDPKYGITDATLPVFDFIPVPEQYVAIELSNYVVDSIEDVDNVEIPGGRTLLETDQYQVPIYTETILIPNGYSVQNVQLINRTDLVMTRGLNLPITRNEIASSNNDNIYSTSALISGTGWYPEEVYNWEVFKNANGSSTLIITVYPFSYNSKTTEVKFYKNFEFDIDYIQTSVSITEVQLNEEYDFSEMVEAEVTLENNWTNDINILLTGEIHLYLNDELIGSAQLQTLTLRPGKTATTVSFNTSDLPAGLHTLRIIVKDNSGQHLDSATRRFKVGFSKVQVMDLTAEPEIFKIGHNVKIEMDYENTGSVNLDGVVQIIIRNGDSEITQEFSQNFTRLAPTESNMFMVNWSTVGVARGTYFITSYVIYDGKYTASAVIEVRDLATALRDIIEYIISLNLPRGIENSLISKLENAAMAIERGQYTTTLNILNAFINELDAIKGKKITYAHAEILVYKVENVIDNMGG